MNHWCLELSWHENLSRLHCECRLITGIILIPMMMIINHYRKPNPSTVNVIILDAKTVHSNVEFLFRELGGFLQTNEVWKWQTTKRSSSSMFEFWVDSKWSKGETTITVAQCNWFVLEVGEDVQLILLIS